MCRKLTFVNPDLQAALACEDVRLEVSGSNTLVGVINAIMAPAFPLRIMKLCVYTRWCSGQGCGIAARPHRWWR